MELKHWEKDFLTTAVQCLNCTVMELKLVSVTANTSVTSCLNCTVMELKLDCIVLDRLCNKS